ncbi:MAG: aldo/keto reductase [Dysgonamonadaceae bacterium]|jgi:diketogulonate reductase-like aldo/keto reductase|nr:aldo/keto reductase [Dysgonamonadaceae bacterium]
MNSLKDTFRLRNGIQIPCIGFGTWQTPDGRVAEESVRFAIEKGYRHIDTAAIYENEKSVGIGIKNSNVPRKELFITSKVWNTEKGYDTTLRAFDKTLSDLGLDYLDLYLIHWPAIGNDGEKYNKETWRAFERLYEEKRIKAIGVSNFKPHHLEALMKTAKEIPMVNQIEFHPGQMQKETVDFCRKHEILIEAWSPLGTGRLLANPELSEIASHYNKSVALLCIRWCLQNNVLPLPKSVTPSRIEENTAAFDFEITPEDMQTINSMPYIGGSGLDPDNRDF